MRTHMINGNEVTVNLQRVLAGAPLASCIRKVKRARTQTKPITILDDVTYRRTNGEVVRGWIEEATTTALYIRCTDTFKIVAAPRDRVRRVAK